jgi:hypothetical protein
MFELLLAADPDTDEAGLVARLTQMERLKSAR